MLKHDGTDMTFQNNAGDLIIQNLTNDKDVIFKSDDGSGGTATYFQLDGSDVITLFSKSTRHVDSVTANFGNANDLRILHNGTNSFITNHVGDLKIIQYTDDADISFQSDDGSGGITEYFRVDGGSEKVIFSKTLNVVNSSANGKAATFDDGTSALHVVPSLGSGGYTGLSAAGDIGLIFTIDNDNTTDSTSNGLLIAPHTQTSGGLKILENGNVGIGISSPATKLTVADTSTPTIRIQDTTNDRHLQLFHDNNDSYIRASSSSKLRLQTDGANDRVLIDTNGNVGIGTTNPVSKLEVDGGDIEVDDIGSGLILKSPNGTRYRVTVDNSGNLVKTAI